jgi:hypothetical protein
MEKKMQATKATKRYSLDQLAGEPITLTVGDKELLASPITVGDYAAFERHCREERVRAFMASTNGVAKDVIRDVCLRLLSGTFSEPDIQAELDTFQGARFMLHRSLVKNHPELKLEEVDGTVRELNQAVAAVLAISGFGGDENPPVSGQTGAATSP